ncbi:probable two-component response regulator protein [Rhizobium etli CFN 42]|uniref:Probable two-component response regulator protein n=1 Tax=Rhizobium etli (strain ATCC 51251 / DSM 11541 / JCM 21823 / NBRC 15573 / CFN 42) TaxID=347834 RepID=Q2K534_RHIEC|nr:probable two-component response regulator protein [Rhizobium etli CFN 42]
MAPSVADAMEILTGQSFDFALFDVNLGDETSLGIANRLAAEGMPFVFATGYGEGIAQANSHSDAPVLQKPYTAEGIRIFLPRCRCARKGRPQGRGESGRRPPMKSCSRNRAASSNRSSPACSCPSTARTWTSKSA